MAKQHEQKPSLVVGMGRGFVLLKRCNDLREAMHITAEEVQAAIEHHLKAKYPVSLPVRPHHKQGEEKG